MASDCKYRTVMIIDDTYIDRYVIERVMKRNTFAEEILSMESAIDAIKYLSDHIDEPEKLPQLIFLDINMPEMNGFEFLENYKNLPEHLRKNCIVMMLTTSLHDEDRQKANQNPYVYMFLNKPLTIDKLRTIDFE
jgi:CheY-like chemotaxis protein